MVFFFSVSHSEQSVGARGRGDEIIERQVRPLKKNVAIGRWFDTRRLDASRGGSFKPSNTMTITYL